MIASLGAPWAPGAEAAETQTERQRAPGDMIVVLGEADAEQKQQVYRNLGLRLTCRQERQTVRADVDLAAHRWDSVRVR